MNKTTYENLKQDVTTVMKALTNFLKLPEQEGFITELSKNDDHMDFKIADDKFSIYWFYDIRTRQGYAKTLHYAFEPKAEGDFFQPELLKRGDLLFTAEGVQLTGSNFNPYPYDGNSLNVMFQQYFSLLKNYLAAYHSDQIRKVKSSHQGLNPQVFSNFR